jgi:Pyruvate/2-oxoacid:ferredoxin oxidoreductase delta subunit
MRKRLLVPVLVIFSLAVLFAIARPIVYQIHPQACWQCGRCVMVCPHNAIAYSDTLHSFWINPDLCNGCGLCVNVCPHNAIYEVTGNADEYNVPQQMNLSCSPNPMRDYADLHISLPIKAKGAELVIHDCKGRTVYTSLIGSKTTSVRWLGKDNRGRALPSGVYFATLSCNNAKTTTKITMVRR